MHSDQFTVDKRLNGMYLKYPWSSLGFLGVKRHADTFTFLEKSVKHTESESTSLNCYLLKLEKV